MITEETKEYLKKWPLLRIENGEIVGCVEFSASYNKKSNTFKILKGDEVENSEELVLYGVFDISIAERKAPSFSKLPSLRVEDIDYIPARHINKTDHKACLCSPLEEDEFLYPVFDFKKYFEHLVIPFLYGQVYYSIYNEWPWFDYMHGIVGILESYGRFDKERITEECIPFLRTDKIWWPKVKVLLLQKTYIKGHTLCFCGSNDYIRRCHPESLKGILRLQKDIKEKSLSLDQILDQYFSAKRVKSFPLL